MYNSAGAQNEVAQFLDDLRAFSGLVRARANYRRVAVQVHEFRGVLGVLRCE